MCTRLKITRLVVAEMVLAEDTSPVNKEVLTTLHPVAAPVALLAVALFALPVVYSPL